MTFPEWKKRRATWAAVHAVGFALLALAVLFLLASQAHADVLLEFDGGAVQTDTGAADAGAPLDVPVELEAGDPAPFHGYELSDARAQQILANQQAQQPAASSALAVVVVAVVAFVVGGVAGAYLAKK